jgi:hypothetical protein
VPVDEYPSGKGTGIGNTGGALPAAAAARASPFSFTAIFLVAFIPPLWGTIDAARRPPSRLGHDPPEQSAVDHLATDLDVLFHLLAGGIGSYLPVGRIMGFASHRGVKG